MWSCYFVLRSYVPFICSVCFGISNVPYFLSINPFFQPVHHRRTHAHKHKHQFSLCQYTDVMSANTGWHQILLLQIYSEVMNTLTLTEPVLWWMRFERERRKNNVKGRMLEKDTAAENTERFVMRLRNWHIWVNVLLREVFVNIVQPAEGLASVKSRKTKSQLILDLFLSCVLQQRQLQPSNYCTAAIIENGTDMGYASLKVFLIKKKPSCLLHQVYGVKNLITDVTKNKQAFSIFELGTPPAAQNLSWAPSWGYEKFSLSLA